MKTFLGIDGGGTTTDFLLIDEAGRVLATRRAGSAYYLEIGLAALQSRLIEGIQATLEEGGLSASQLEFAFIGLPAYGEDSALLRRLDSIVADILPQTKFRCDNDMVCGWAGALAASDGYGEFETRRARAGGWGELFGDEGSAHWIAREALTLFARMSDGRTPKTPLYGLIRDRFGLRSDLDVCAAAYGPPALTRSQLAALAPVVAGAAREGDPEARELFRLSAHHLASLVHAVRDRLDVPLGAAVAVSYSGGLFHFEDLLKPLLEAALSGGERQYQFVAPRLGPLAGAALYAAKLADTVLTDPAVRELARGLAARSRTEIK